MNVLRNFHSQKKKGKHLKQATPDGFEWENVNKLIKGIIEGFYYSFNYILKRAPKKLTHPVPDTDLSVLQ